MTASEKKQPPKKVKIRKLTVAWTCDDGPTAFTDAMLAVFTKTLPKKAIPVTWYIQYDYLKKRKSISFYKDLQNKYNHEIAIHGVSTIANHMLWLPNNRKKNGEATSFATIGDAIIAIEAFNKYLKRNGLNARFVRAPTGLHSELMLHMRKLGIKKNTDSLSRKIILKQLQLTKNTPKPVRKAAANFSALQAGLRRQNLHLWGGKKSGTISVQSWEVESAGKSKDITRIDTLDEKFMNDLFKRDKKDHSLVILCHDTTAADLKEVKKDILLVEKYAKKYNAIVEYYTMSELYKKVTGNAP